MEIKCFIEIMKCKGYMQVQKEDFGIKICCKTEKTAKIIEKFIEENDDIWTREEKIKKERYYTIYDINKIIKHFDKLWEEKATEKSTAIYFKWSSYSRETCKEIDRQLKKKNSIYELHWYQFDVTNHIYNKKIIEEKERKKREKCDEIDNFIDKLFS